MNHSFGYTPNPAATEAFVAALKHQSFDQTPAWQAGADERDAYLWRAATKLLNISGQQPSLNQGQVGSCVGFGTSGAATDTAACEIVWKNEREKLLARMSPEAAYAAARECGNMLRTRGDGCFGSAAAKAMTGLGTLLMQSYPGFDLTRYDETRCRKWGFDGLPQELKKIADDHLFGESTRITTAEQAARALQNGYAINICSDVGFSDQRDQDGFARASGSWAHSMYVRGYRGGRRRGFLIQNSWGNDWIRGPVWPSDQPHGSFWCDFDVMERIVRQGDSFAYAGFAGFVAQKIDWSRWIH